MSIHWTEEQLNDYLIKHGKPPIPVKKKSKYGNQSIIIDGIKRDSLTESNRLEQLKLLQRMGVIFDLKYQVKYELIPSQEGKYRKERPVTYIADFVYKVKMEDGSTREIVEDSKGHKTKEYIIKRKLMLYIHNISIKET